ncbi:MAG: type IV toxin-antitoxin system AbiEi family antitoxin [Gammaproteobacteria bacterium]
MQPIKQLAQVLGRLADDEHYLFSPTDLQAVLPDQAKGAFRVLLSRAEKGGLLKRVCRGLYLYPKVNHSSGLILYHAAARLRADEFNYISLESALSDAGVISQIPTHWITLMSSGRSHIIQCGHFGRVEFIHTKKCPNDLINQLTYDARCHLWRASVALAIKDMKAARRSTDLIDLEMANEPI